MREQNHLIYIYIYIWRSNTRGTLVKKKIGSSIAKSFPLLFFIFENLHAWEHHHQDLGSSNVASSFPRCFFH